MLLLNEAWIGYSSWVAYGFLAIAIISLWLHKKALVFGGLLAIAAFFALLAGRLQSPALLFILLFAALNHCAFKAAKPSIRVACIVMVLISSIALWFHWIPGFSNWLLVKDLRMSQNSIPFHFFLNFDKPLMGLFILGFSNFPLLKTRSEWGALLKKTLPMAVLSIVFMIGVACLMGYIKYDLKWNKWLVVFMFNNLLFVSIAEETLCRGLVQTSLYRLLGGYRYGGFFALLLASLFFGLLHTGNSLYLFLSMLAGVCYGLIYHLSKRIEASIITHFMLNAVHCIAFSYPALATAL